MKFGSFKALARPSSGDVDMRRHMGALASYVKDGQSWPCAIVQVFVTVREHYQYLRLVVSPVLAHLPSCWW